MTLHPIEDDNATARCLDPIVQDIELVADAHCYDLILDQQLGRLLQ
jgi:hypothetical protein